MTKNTRIYVINSNTLNVTFKKETRRKLWNYFGVEVNGEYVGIVWWHHNKGFNAHGTHAEGSHHETIEAAISDLIALNWERVEKILDGRYAAERRERIERDLAALSEGREPTLF